jgi:hypothetical protein
MKASFAFMIGGGLGVVRRREIWLDRRRRFTWRWWALGCPGRGGDEGDPATALVGMSDEGRDCPSSALAGMGQGVALEVDAAALPGGAEYLGGGRLDAFARVADDQLHAARAARDSTRLGPGDAISGFPLA